MRHLWIGSPPQSPKCPATGHQQPPGRGGSPGGDGEGDPPQDGGDGGGLPAGSVPLCWLGLMFARLPGGGHVVFGNPL